MDTNDITDENLNEKIPGPPEDDNIVDNDLSENVDYIKKILCSDIGGSLIKINDFYIQNMVCLPGSKQGDNYMSIVKRVKVYGKSKKTKQDYIFSLIIKRQIASLSRRQLFRCDEAFSNEITAYNVIIKEMKKFSKINLSIPYCYYAIYGKTDEDDIIVLEDLCEKKYQMSDRLKGLDYEHCSIVMKKLGQFHGISLSMKYLRPNIFKNICNNIHDIVYCAESSEFYSKIIESALNDAIKSIKNTYKDDIKLIPIIKNLEKLLNGNLYNKMMKIILENNNGNVICHGDLWINNLMFHYNNINNKCDNCYLIDLQSIRYTSPIIDLLHFIYTSTIKQVRCQYLYQLLNDYHNSLIDTLSMHLYNNINILNAYKKQFNINNIINEFKNKSIYGFGVGLWLLPAITFHPDNIINLDNITLNDITNNKANNLLTNDYHLRVKDIIWEFMENGLI